MECPTCGAQLSQTLSYCNRCGANLSLVKDQSGTKAHGKAVEDVMGSMIVTAIPILGIILGALVLMKKGQIAEELVELESWHVRPRGGRGANGRSVDRRVCSVW